MTDLAWPAAILVAVIGVTVLLLSLWGLIVPSRLISMVRSVLTRRGGVLIAVGVRLLLGIAFLLAADFSRFPPTVRVLGVVTLVAAVGLAIVGHERMKRMVDWVARWPLWAVRGWLVVGAGFGAFLFYATH
jgi:hypothetical protein